jgi:hypothetical protein
MINFFLSLLVLTGVFGVDDGLCISIPYYYWLLGEEVYKELKL